MSYIGVLEQLRNPENLWEILNALVEENADFSKDFELKFVGRIDDKILQQIEFFALGKNVNLCGYLSHNRAVEEMNNSDILLITNFDRDTSKGIIPGKLFEYLAVGKKIVSFGPKESDVADILKETGSGRHFGYADNQEIKNYILEIYQQWKTGNLEANQQSVQQYSRRNLTKKLSEIL